jgi:hypothetical protein
MSNNGVPFYTQTAILDSHIANSNPEADPDVVEIIIEMLQTKPELRDYFFRSRPNAAWAPILWRRDFFETPPHPQETEIGYILPSWDVQGYLISVADQAPEIVVKHVETIQGHAWYKGQAIRALCYIPAQEAASVVPTVIEWLKDPQIADIVVQQAYDFILEFAKRQYSAAFDLFQALTVPIPFSDVKDLGGFLPRGGAISKFRRDWDEKKIFSEGLDLLRKLSLQQVVIILEDHLCTAMRIEAQVLNTPDFEFSSGWRTAIADTGQDLETAYRDRLLRGLRDTLEIWVQQDSEEVESLIERYLTEKHEIIRRLGLHLLYRFPKQYQIFVVQELRNTANLDNVSIHHEFFMLLQEGYPYLEVQDQEKLAAKICKGPNPEDAQRLAAWAQQQYGADPDEYVERYSKKWIRDRLWMIRDQLIGQPKQVLNESIDELGEPEHPAFTRWSTGVFSVQEVSPITDQEMFQMTPDELVDFLKQWQPDPNRIFGPEQVSYSGMANAVARLVAAQPQKYANHIVPIAMQRPEYAYALLSQSTEREQTNFLPWELNIELCEQLLANEIVRDSINRDSDYSWVNVRQSIVHLLKLGLNNPDRAIPAEHLSRIRDILFILVDDADPIPEHDRPGEGWTRHNDPGAVAINHVRPGALSALIEYARTKAEIEQASRQDTNLEESSPKRLETNVSETLTRKLDRRQDPSWAVHSVYGYHLALLHWLDEDWVEQHIDQILPEEIDEENIWYYVSAWDSFVAYNKFYVRILELLRRKYQQAIDNLNRGYITKTHFRPEQGLAIHLVWEYLLADYDLRSSIGQQSLIATFFKQVPPEARDSAAWILWRICEVSSQRDVYWSRIRILWEWRANEASAANHSTDFDAEMRWFAKLPLEAPESETISSLWPLLEGLVPHITRSEYRDIGWDAMEEYLAQEVDRHPLKTIQLYRLMHDQVAKPHFFYPREEARKIIESAAAAQSSRYEALALINSLARLGFHQYKDIYERYTG